MGNSPVTSEFPAQRSNNAKNVSIWWCHHEQYWLLHSVLILTRNSSPGILHHYSCYAPLQWRHDGLNGVSNHQPHDCLRRHRPKKTSKLSITGLFEGNSPVTNEFPAQRASNAENASIWWHHHAPSYFGYRCQTWWCHQMETFSALLAFCEGKSPFTGQWRGALMFSLICSWINGWVNNHKAGWWFETPLRSSRHHCNDTDCSDPGGKQQETLTGAWPIYKVATLLM